MSDLIGLVDGTVRVVPYDPAWALVYAREVERIAPIVGAAGVSITFEHTGSTSIPGLAAKPLIDILAVRRSDADRTPAIAALVEAGYSFRGENGIPGRDFFRRGAPRQYHVHLAHADSSFCDDHRTFRDHLRSHPQVAAEYARLKIALAARYPRDREAYIDGKTAFVLATLGAARAG